MPKAKARKKFIEAAIEEGLRDAKAGRLIGPFSNMVEFEAMRERRRIVPEPQALPNADSVEAAIQEGLRAVKEGRVTPAFASMEEFEQFLLATIPHPK